MLSERDRVAIDALAHEAEEQEPLLREHTRTKPPGRKPLPDKPRGLRSSEGVILARSQPLWVRDQYRID